MRAGFNDSPILTPDQDQFGIDPFARALATSLSDFISPIGSTVAINGAWGSGKSSVVNLVRHHLSANPRNKNINIVEFKCWWFRGEEALTLAFLQTLSVAIGKTLGDRAKLLLGKIGRTLLQAGPVIGPAVNMISGGFLGGFAKGSLDFSKRFLSEQEGIDELIKRLSDELAKQEKRFLVIIDDIDRLAPDEALLVFQLVKSVGRLPNVLYLLVFDRELSEKLVKERYPSEGPHFLEKIIQASFDVPLPARDELNHSFLTEVEQACGPISGADQVRRFMNIFYDVVVPYLSTPRDLTRLINAIAVSWSPVASEVNVADFVALETIRVFEPALYQAIRVEKEAVCGLREGRSDGEPAKTIDRFLSLVPVQRRDTAKAFLTRLFPRLENMGYGSDFLEIWRAQRLLCTENHFDTYFRMSIGDEALSSKDIDELIANSGDSAYVRKSFMAALNTIRKSGKSKVPLLLDELNVHASKIAGENLAALIHTIFQIADDINRDEDRERGFGFTNNHLRIHWLIRKLTFGRCTLVERDRILMSACEKAQLGWLVDFTSSAQGDYEPDEGPPEPTEKCLISAESLPTLLAHTLATINSAAASGSLLNHSRLPYILYRWREFAKDDGQAVKQWLGDQLKNDEAVVRFADAFTGESWTHGMGISGPGDRVSMREATAAVEGLDSIMDAKKFRARLEELEGSGRLGDTALEKIKLFLSLWRKKESRDRR